MGKQAGAHMHLFLRRAAIDHHRCDQMIQCVDPAIGHLVRLALQAHGVNCFGAREPADQHAAIVLSFFAVGDIIE